MNNLTINIKGTGNVTDITKALELIITSINSPDVNYNEITGGEFNDNTLLLTITEQK